MACQSESKRRKLIAWCWIQMKRTDDGNRWRNIEPVSEKNTNSSWSSRSLTRSSYLDWQREHASYWNKLLHMDSKQMESKFRLVQHYAVLQQGSLKREHIKNTTNFVVVAIAGEPFQHVEVASIILPQQKAQEQTLQYWWQENSGRKYHLSGNKE